MTHFNLALASGVILLGASLGATASPMHYSASLGELNNSGVTGTANLTYNSNANTLNVHISATGLEPGMPHAQHIHGVIGGNSVSPTLANDTDGDGYIELMEADPAYGAILVPLTSPPGGNPTMGPGFPTAPGGMIDFNQTYDLSSAVTFNDGYSSSDLFPLTNREIVLHGMSLSAGQGADGGEADGTAGYKGVLPVASGVITSAQPTQAVPEPNAVGVMGLGLVMLGGLFFVEKRRASRVSGESR